MMIVVSDHNFPNIRAAFEAIERDGGAHLIGMIYPGAPVDFTAFDVPGEWMPLLAPAEIGIARLRAASGQDFETFVAGGCSEQDAIRDRQGDLSEAQRLLNDFFNGWPMEDAPAVPA
jgi:hypothetical protein